MSVFLPGQRVTGYPSGAERPHRPRDICWGRVVGSASTPRGEVVYVVWDGGVVAAPYAERRARRDAVVPSALGSVMAAVAA